MKDKYGDYGFIGFFMVESGAPVIDADRRGLQNLIHFCFSCRTLGMLVEQWVYDFLRRPAIAVVGDVLTDLSQPREIDRIRFGAANLEDQDVVAKVAPEIRIHGGCEVNSIAHYLAPYSDEIQVSGISRLPTTSSG